jgi:hypothetical protein
VVHVALARRGRQRVDLLLHLEHVQRGDTQDLGLAALEDRRAVHARDDLHLGIQRTDVREAAAVDADALGEDAAAHDLLRDRLVGAANSSAPGQLARLDGGDELRLDASLTASSAFWRSILSAIWYTARARRRRDRRRSRRSPSLYAGRPGTAGSPWPRCSHDVLRRDELLDEGLGGLEALRDDLLAGLGAGLDEVPAVLGGLGLDHHDRDVAVLEDATGDHQVEDGLLDLRGVGNATHWSACSPWPG